MSEQTFTEWLCREFPPGTVIDDPRWWAARIYDRAIASNEEWDRLTAERDALKAELRHAEGVVYYCNDGDDERLTALCRRLRAALGEKA